MPVLVLLLPVVAAIATMLAIAGWLLSRSPGVEGANSLIAVPGRERGPAVIRVTDALGVILERVLLRAYGPRRRARLAQRLDRAGRPEKLTERAFLRRKAGYTTIGLIMLPVFWISGLWPLGLLLILICFAWMDLWLRSVARRRRQEIARGLPDFLDVLAVTVNAGLGFQPALHRVCESDPSALGDEIRRTLNDLRYGVGRRAALELLRDRNDVPSMGSFVTATLQAEELGRPLADALVDIAAEVRRDAAQRARQAAARAGTKASLVVSMTVVPGAMILIIASMVLANLPTFRNVFG
jgi:tight adherence protein C